MKGFIEAPVKFEFTLQLTQEDIDEIVHRLIYENTNDWWIVDSVANRRRGKLDIGKETLPLVIRDIRTNKTYKVTKARMLKAIGLTLIDFPYALDTTSGFILVVHKLTAEDLDEIIQVAALGEMVYAMSAVSAIPEW